MSTVRDVVTSALRQARVIGVNGSPTSSEAERGLEAFQSLIDTWVAGTMFGTLEDVYLEEDETAKEGKRYYVPAGLVLTPATSDYETEAGTTRQPRDLALYEALTAAGVRTVQLYDRTEWVELTGLTLDSDAPLASRGMLGLAACVAVHYVDMFGGEGLRPNTIANARRFMGNISGKQGSTQDKIASEYF